MELYTIFHIPRPRNLIGATSITYDFLRVSIYLYIVYAKFLSIGICYIIRIIPKTNLNIRYVRIS